MGNILVYALHYEGAINKNSLGAVSEGAKLGRRARRRVPRDRRRRGRPATTSRPRSATTAPRRCCAPRAPRASRSRSSTRWPRRSTDGGYDYALFGGGLLGFEIGAGLAARLGAGVAMEVTAVRAEGGKLSPSARSSATRRSPRSTTAADVGIIIGRLNAFEIRESGGGDGAGRGRSTFELRAHFSTQATMVTRGEQRGADVDIEGADILVAGGRGLGKAEGFQLAEDLAAAFGGNTAVAATRAVVDAGWYPVRRRRSARRARPSRRSCTSRPGISGAIQHKVGMQTSENIVAINKDANAPIFEFSDLGIVGDLQQDPAQADRGREGQEGRLSRWPAATATGTAVARRRSRRRSTRPRSSSSAGSTPRTS